jgi:sugar O-acyltransferase (sialic acid O-acetyltransferase NeuD family)
VSAAKGRARRVILVGAGRFAEEITDIAADGGIEVAAWIEGLDESRASLAHDPPILWADAQASFEPDLAIVPAIGSVQRRALVERLVAAGRRLETVVHPSAVVARSAVLEPGCVVFPNVVIGARTVIGRGTILNRGSLVGHHVVIGSFSFLGPGAIVGGGVIAGDQVYFAMGAVVRDDRRVGEGAIVGAGAVAVSDVDAGLTVLGVPARPIA